MACQGEIIDDCRIVRSVFGRRCHDFTVTPYHVTDMRLHHALLLSPLLFYCCGFLHGVALCVAGCAACLRAGLGAFPYRFLHVFFRELVPFLPGFDLADVVLAVQVEMVYRLWMLIQELVRLADGRLALEEFPRLFFRDESLGCLLTDKLFLPRGGGSRVPVIRLFGRHGRTPRFHGDSCFLRPDLFAGKGPFIDLFHIGIIQFPDCFLGVGDRLADVVRAHGRVYAREGILHELRCLQREIDKSRTVFPVLADMKINPALFQLGCEFIALLEVKVKACGGSACFPIQVFRLIFPVVRCSLIA